MLLSHKTALSYRYLDARTNPKVYGVSLHPQNKEITSQHVGLALCVPFYLAHFDDIGKLPNNRKAFERAYSRERLQKRKKTLQKWNVMNVSTPSDDPSESHSEITLSIPYKQPVLLTFSCPSHARAHADAYTHMDVMTTSHDTAVATTFELRLSDAEFLSERMNVPLCVVLRAWTDLSLRQSHAEVHLRMMRRKEDGSGDEEIHD